MQAALARVAQEELGLDLVRLPAGTELAVAVASVAVHAYTKDYLTALLLLKDELFAHIPRGLEA